MKYLRLISVILVISLLSLTTVFANEYSINDDFLANATDAHDPYNVMVFDSISDIYVNNHLYDFDEQTLYRETLLKLLDENPEMFYRILNTMLSTMDRFSSFHSPSSGFLSLGSLAYGITLKGLSNEEAQANGLEKGIYIDSVKENSNAALAGIKAGDRITSVLGIDLDGVGFSGAVTLIRRSTGILITQDELSGNATPDNAVTAATFGVSRKNPDSGEFEDLTISMGIGEVENDELSYTLYENNTACITISSFIGENLAQNFKSVLTTLYDEGYKNITFDLRNNGGGVMDTALEMINMLIPEKDKILCHIKEKGKNEPMSILSVGDGMKFDSINVLINKNTASAAELFSMVMRDALGAKLIGENSHGKFLGQKNYSFTDGGTLSVTAFEILSADLIQYDTVGLEPDYVCPTIIKKFEVPALPFFNHVNYHEIVPNVKSDPTLALEMRLELLGLLENECVDGVFDSRTENAVKVFRALQTRMLINGVIDDEFVTEMTRRINELKVSYVSEDSQLDVALLCHKNNSQAKRRAAEYREEQSRYDNIEEEEELAEIKEYEDIMRQEAEEMKNNK